VIIKKSFKIPKR